jgi:hypothetical protein
MFVGKKFFLSLKRNKRDKKVSEKTKKISSREWERNVEERQSREIKTKIEMKNFTRWVYE